MRLHRAGDLDGGAHVAERVEEAAGTTVLAVDLGKAEGAGDVKVLRPMEVAVDLDGDDHGVGAGQGGGEAGGGGDGGGAVEAGRDGFCAGLRAGEAGRVGVDQGDVDAVVAQGIAEQDVADGGGAEFAAACADEDDFHGARLWGGGGAGPPAGPFGGGRCVPVRKAHGQDPGRYGHGQEQDAGAGPAGEHAPDAEEAAVDEEAAQGEAGPHAGGGRVGGLDAGAGGPPVPTIPPAGLRRWNRSRTSSLFGLCETNHKQPEQGAGDEDHDRSHEVHLGGRRSGSAADSRAVGRGMADCATATSTRPLARMTEPAIAAISAHGVHPPPVPAQQPTPPATPAVSSMM